MFTSQITFDYAETVRLVDPFVSNSRGAEPVPLADLVDFSRLQETIMIPDGLCLCCEQSCSKGVQRLRVVVGSSRDDGLPAVTRSFHLRGIISGPESAESIALAIKQIIIYANEMLPALYALKLSRARTEHEIDYRDPKHLVSLLEDRGCTILDAQALRGLVEEEPGPLYYEDIDLCDGGRSWEQSGGPWATRLEEELVKLGAVRRESDQT